MPLVWDPKTSPHPRAAEEGGWEGRGGRWGWQGSGVKATMS